MDGMPLTLSQIQSFFPANNLFENVDVKALLDDLVEKGYIKFEHPKKLVSENTENGVITSRIYDETKPKGYNIVTGKLSFEINKILNPFEIAPTLVATDMVKIVVPDGKGIRKLTIREGLRIFGYPENYEIPVKESLAFRNYCCCTCNKSSCRKSFRCFGSVRIRNFRNGNSRN
jgi:DNA (cytosine-5)-methyltransferase 1